MSLDVLSSYRSMDKLNYQLLNQNMTQNDKKVAEENLVITTETPVGNDGDVKNEKNPNAKNKEASEGQIKSAISVANQKIKMTNTRCEFMYHEATKRVSIKVVDKATDEVIKEIPPEETLEMVEKLWELAGLIVDEKR